MHSLLTIWVRADKRHLRNAGGCNWDSDPFYGRFACPVRGMETIEDRGPFKNRVGKSIHLVKSGDRFGKLVIIGKHYEKYAMADCICDCGKSHSTVITAFFRKPHPVRSCGCMNRNKRGPQFTPERNAMKSIWCGMKRRCYDKDDKSYKNYGGRGIFIDERWLDSLDTFIVDMGIRPEGLSLERIDNNGPYSKENCKWGTTLEQGRNRRNVKFVDYKGKRMCITEASEMAGVSYKALAERMRKPNTVFEEEVAKYLARKANQARDDYKRRIHKPRTKVS